MAQAMILRRGGGSGFLPIFTYTGIYQYETDDAGGWWLRFMTSGTLRFSRIGSPIDVFLVGGGAGGSRGPSNVTSGSGGGGGYTATYRNVVALKDVNYTITIGPGGAATASANTAGGTGSPSSAFGYTANGGVSTVGTAGGAGGSGGGAGGAQAGTLAGSAGGANGANGGSGATSTGGVGQGATTREFGETWGPLYAGGGGGAAYGSNARGAGGAGGGGMGGNASYDAEGGVPNTGSGGGGGGYAKASGAGGSGTVIIRRHLG